MGRYASERRAIRSEIISIGWHLRGFIDYNAGWSLSPIFREDCLRYMAERMKIVEKSKLPLL